MTPAPSPDHPRAVVVCMNCLRACCWNGVFMCDIAPTDGTLRTIAELTALDREHADWWAEPGALPAIARRG